METPTHASFMLRTLAAPRRAGALLAAITALLVACSGDGQGGTRRDTGPDQGGADTGGGGADVGADAGPSRCGSAADCDDGIACTVDECGADGACAHRGDDARCNDGRFCNGVERCDVAARGCARGAAPTCDDGMACTTDHCDEAENRCVAVPRDGDGDGDPDRACGGGDCNDGDRAVSSLAREVCNGRDDDCDGMTDEGVQNTCGNCDPTCQRRVVGGAGGAMFNDAGRRGVEFDPMAGGLVVRAQTRSADYLWVPNTAESTVSKWDATMSREIARYRVGLPSGECRGMCCHANGCNMPSRVVVDGFGDAYVANRGFLMQGTVTKLAADVRDCVDRNGNGMIDTSTGPTPLAWGADECVLWTAPVGRIDAVLRSIAIDRGDGMFPQGYPWVGGWNEARVWKLNPANGTIMRDIAIPRSAYGAVVAPDGRMWIHTPSSAIHSVHTVTGAVGAVVPVPARGTCGAQSYGITMDTRGRVWLSGRTCRDAAGYDPATGQWTRMDLTSLIPAGGGVGLGITIDPMNRVWAPVSMSADWQGPTRIAVWDADAFVPGGTIPVSAARVIAPTVAHMNPTALGADRAGNIWVASATASQGLLRHDPTTGAFSVHPGPNMVYTYTDFTGAVRRTIIGSGTYTEDYDAGCDRPVYARLTWDGDTPAGTSLTFTIRTAAMASGLGSATVVPVAVAPMDRSPVDLVERFRAAGVMPARHARVIVTFQPNASPVATPVLRSVSLTWQCPYRPPGS